MAHEKNFLILKSTFFSGIFTFRRDALLSMNRHQMSKGENVDKKKTRKENEPRKQPRVHGYTEHKTPEL